MARAAEQWAKRVKRLERSGLSIRTFAEREGLKAGSLSFWKWKLGRDRGQNQRGVAAQAEPVQLIELRTETAARPATEPFEVELRSGRRVRVTAGFDAAELARLVVVLEEARS
jgi:hypothetical protein